MKRILDSAGADGHDVRVVMSEARDVCSGATERNGRHISPPLYRYRDHGQAVA